MKLTEKLLGYLNRVFDKGPQKTLALRIRYSGSAMSWSINDGVLTTWVTGGPGGPLVVALKDFTVSELAAHIAGFPGYSVLFVDTSSIPGLLATVLIDGSGNQDESNGDHLYAYTSALWAYLEAQGAELHLARAAIAQALQQMAANTAGGEWVDEHGSYYGIPRSNGEADADYAARIVAEVGRARGTTVAIGEALRRAILADDVDVTDYSVETTAGDGTKSYGLFDVDATIDVNAPITAEAIDTSTRLVIESMRDAGTHLRKLKYIRRSTLPLYMGASLRVGVYVTVAFKGLRLDGSWSLGGSEDLDGLKNV